MTCGVAGGPVPAPIHQCPPPGTGVMPCCGRTPFEVPLTERMTADPWNVTCPSPAGLPAPTMDPSQRANGGSAVASRTGTGPAGEAILHRRGGPVS